DVPDFLPGGVGHAGHVYEQVVRPDVDVAIAARSGGEPLEGRPDAERRKDMRGDLQAELAPDAPRVVGALIAQIHLAAHDHVHELIARREPLLLDAGRVEGILIARIRAENGGARALE